MARRRFYATSDLVEGAIVTLSSTETHHLMQVLRMTPGDSAFVFDGSGNEHKCTFRSVRNSLAQVEVAEKLIDIVESPTHLTLAQGLAKGEKFDFIVQKATELGVNRIAPLVTRYSDVRLVDQQAAKRVERWQRISLEALKQCGRRKLVEISAPVAFQDFVRANKPSALDSSELSPCDGETWLTFNERGGLSISEALQGAATAGPVVALVGPEGGWSDGELDLLSERGCKSVTLGPRVLRTETAAVVAVTLIQHAMGDLS